MNPVTRRQPPRVQAVLVLYKRCISDSQAFTSFRNISRLIPHVAECVELLVYDNSPTPDIAYATDGIPFEYVHDAKNGGLQSAYCAALARAKANQVEWLMLLDQDTTLSSDYLLEVLESISTYTDAARVAGVIPRLVENSRISSPFVKKLIRDRAVAPDTIGIATQKISAFNSGAVFRVKSIEQIGGFPEEFKVEALDHAVFHLLQTHGNQIFVLNAQLEHKLSMNDLANSMPLERYSKILAAEVLFVRKFGGLWGRIRMHIRFLALAVKQLKRSKERKFASTSLQYFFGRGR